MRHRIAQLFLDAAAWLIWRLYAPDSVQLAACRFIDRAFPLLSRAYGLGKAGKRRPVRRATMLNRMLSQFTRIDPDFTLHTDIENGALLRAATAGDRGVLICTAHLRLSFAAHRALRDLGLKPVFVGITERGTAGWNWGDAEPLATIDAARADVLIRCLRHVRRGNAVIAFVDYRGAPGTGAEPLLISPNAFTWAALNAVPLLFMATRLKRDGRIAIEFERPDAAVSSAAEFAAFIERRTGWDCVVKRPKEERRGHVSPICSSFQRNLESLFFPASSKK